MKRKTLIAFALAILSVAMLAFAGACEGNAHAHAWSDGWSFDGAKHWRVCTVEGCDAKTDEAECSGGTATCKNKAVCEVCGNGYGEINAANHESDEFNYIANNNGTHKKTYKCCGAIAVGSEACSGGEATCVKKAVCDLCKAEYGELSENHVMSETWTSDGTKHWHACTVVGCEAKADETECSGGTATCKTKAVCEVCENEYGEFDSENHESTETEYVSNNDGTHKKTYKCCGAVADESENCSGGTATCKTKAICDLCKTEYGEFDSENHESTETEYVSNNDGTHNKVLKCCGAAVLKNEECSGGEATCVKKAVCDLCKAEYGELSETHAFADGWDKSDAEYDYKKCVCGKLDREHGFKKTVDKINQKLLTTEDTVSLDLGGVSDYSSIKSITLGESDLGTDADALSLGNIKTDAKLHGEKTIEVVVVDEEYAEHEVSVSVVLVTGIVNTDDELKELLYCGKTEADRYGYYVLGSDVVYTGERNFVRFYGTFDGNGKSVSTNDMLNGLFTYTLGSTVKDLTIKATISPAAQAYRTIISNSTSGGKFINVTIIYEGGVYTSAVNGNGFLFKSGCDAATFDGLTVYAQGKKIGSLFGNAINKTVFNDCSVYADGVTYLAGSSDDNKTDFENVSGIELRSDDSEPDSIDLWQENPVFAHDFGDKTVTEVICRNYSLGGDVNALVIPEELKADKANHGYNTAKVKFADGTSMYLPVVLVTAELKTEAEFNAAAMIPTSDDSAKFGYYRLGCDIAFTHNVNGGLFGAGDSDERSEELGFRGTIDGQGKYTISTSGAALVYNGGFFGLLGKGAVIKNVKFNAAIASGATALFATSGHNSRIENVEITISSASTNANAGVLFGFFSGSVKCKNMTVNAAGLDLTQLLGIKIGWSGIVPQFENVTVNAKSLVAICKKGFGGDPVTSLDGFTFNETLA